jgi:transposase
MALEVGVTGPSLMRAVERMTKEGRAGQLVELLDGGADRAIVDAILEHLKADGAIRRLVSGDPIDFTTVERLVRLVGLGLVPVLLEAAEETTDAKARERLYVFVADAGSKAIALTARRLAEASQNGGRTAAQRDLLALLGRLFTPEMPLPVEVDLRRFLRHDDAHVRREAVKLLLRSVKRDEAMLAALGDTDGRIVYLALTAAHERCPREGVTLIRGRVERGELDAALRALGIRAVATLRTPDTLRWLIEQASVRSALLRRRKLLAPTPESLAAITAICTAWRQDPEAQEILALANRSRIPEIRNAAKGQPVSPPGRAA